VSNQTGALHELERELIAVVSELALLEPGEVDISSPLFSAHVLDSFAFLQLLAHVEQHYGVSTIPAEMTVERWDTVALIAAFIRAARGQ
jgi:acyl carrier protein